MNVQFAQVEYVQYPMHMYIVQVVDWKETALLSNGFMLTSAIAALNGTIPTLNIHKKEHTRKNGVGITNCD